jgi:hypothetical protein
MSNTTSTTIDINFSGSGHYWLISPDRQDSWDCGICDTEADLAVIVAEFEEQSAAIDAPVVGWSVKREA